VLHSNPSQKIKVGWRRTPFTFIAHAGLPPGYSHTCQTPWSVFLDGSVAPVPSADAPRAPSSRARRSLARPCLTPAERELTRADKVHRPTGRLSRRRDAGRKRVSSRRFQALFNSLFKVLCIFPSRYLFAIGLSPVFSFRWNLPPDSSCNPKQPDSARAHRATANRHGTGFSPSPIPRSKGFERRTRPMAPF
jgi:hypothetical protein